MEGVRLGREITERGCLEVYKIEDFNLEKGSCFPDYDDCLFYVMRDYCDFPAQIVQRINKLIVYYVKKYEYEHMQDLVLPECELSVWMDIDRNTKDMYLNFLILDDKREIKIDGNEQIKPDDKLYSVCRSIFIQRLEEFLFADQGEIEEVCVECLEV